MIQKDFPRGGKKPANAPPSKSLLFEKNNPIKAKKVRAKKGLKKKDNEEDALVASTAQSLTYANLCEGMVILGRVHEVTDYDLIISLPGRLSGRVKATDISESYTNLLQNVVNSGTDSLSEFKPLPELYNPGDNVVAFVKALGEDKKWRVTLSLESHMVNQNLSSNFLSKGSKIVCTVSSVEDHGYVIETGIANVRAFLSKKDVEENCEYFPGKQITCAVKSIKTADNATTISLSTKEKHLGMMLEEIKSVDCLLPGIQLTLSVKKILSNGLQVNFDNGKIGYINQVHLPKALSKYEPGMEVDGTLLYIIPTVKFAYFTLLKQVPEKSELKKGDIVSGHVLCRESNGILFKIGKDLRGFIPYKRTAVDFHKMHEIFVSKSEHKFLVLTYDCMDRVYICTMEKAILNNKLLSKSSFTPGEVMDVTIKEINGTTGFVMVTVGKVIGSVPPEHVSDKGGLLSDMKVGQVMKARVLSSSDKNLKFTLKPLLINSKLPLLVDIKNAKVGSIHHGTIRQITEKGILVKFFGELAGFVPSAFLDPRTSKKHWNHFVGEVVMVEIKTVDQSQNKLALKIVRDNKKKIGFKVGEAVEGTVVDSSVEGIQLRIEKNGSEAFGFLPAGHIAPCVELGSLIAAKTLPGDSLAALVFSTLPNLLLSTTFVPQKEDATTLKDLTPGKSVLYSVEEPAKEGLKVTLSIDNFINAFVKKAYLENENLMHRHQILYGKILTANLARKEVLLSTFDNEIRKESFKTEDSIMTAIDALNFYLLKLKALGEKDYYKNKPISSTKLGQKVEGVVEKVTEHGLVLKLGDNLQGTVRKDHYSGNPKKGDKVKGVVLWVNFMYELVEVSLLPHLVSSVSVKQGKCQDLPLETQLRGTIVLITNWFILVLLKGQFHGGFVVMPARLHLNDLKPNLSTYSIGQKVRCFVVLNGVETHTLPICLPKAVFETKMAKLKKPRILKERSNEMKEVNGVDCSAEKKKNKKRKNEAEGKDENLKKVKKEEPKETILKPDEKMETSSDESEDEKKFNKLSIPACGFYIDTTPSSLASKQESSSESEDESEGQPKQKKKKLSAAERHEQERQKEKEIRKREEELASADHTPNSADQFDRLVLGSPDSSLVWVQYMAFHLQATEVERARAIAKRAVKTINFREEEERLNVWQAWLNLESKFGTPDTLDEVFQEAIKVNDASKVYAHMLTIYSEAGKQIELEKTVNMIVKKFKEQPEMWIKCGATLLKMGLKDKSRHIMQRALQSLPPHEHVNLMIRFAHLENNHGDKERSQTLFEQILNTYPKRTDVWSSYVDSLVKSGDIEIARKVLDRSVSTQVLQPRKMKVLFKKFINFEEQYGTQEAVQHVRELANEYVKEHTE